MITRIARVTLAPESESVVFDIVRKMAEVTPPGLVSFSISRTVHGQTVELVTVTNWTDAQAMADAVGGDLDNPKWPSTLTERMVKISIEVLETVSASPGELDGLDARPAPSDRSRSSKLEDG